MFNFGNMFAIGQLIEGFLKLAIVGFVRVLPYLPYMIIGALMIAFIGYFWLPMLIMVPLFYLVKKEHPDFEINKTLKLLSKGNLAALKVIAVIFFSALLIGDFAYRAGESLIELTNGRHFFTLILSTSIWATLAFGAYSVFDYLMKGDFMKRNILDLVNNKDVLLDFSKSSTRRTFDINVERDLERIKDRVLGQDHIIREALMKLARASKRPIANKPLGTYLFVGPSGTGKTELATALSDIALDGRRLILNMNDYKDMNAVDKLLGGGPTYKGSEKGGVLTNAIRNLGYGVIVFDEVEKGHEDLMDVLMNLLDKGQIRSGMGDLYDATDFLFIMTSNLKQKEILKLTETISDSDDLLSAIKKELEGFFKPEHLNRLNLIAPFAKFKREHIIQIIGKFLFKFEDMYKCELVGVDESLLTNLVLKFEKGVEGGIRGLTSIIETEVEDGFQDVVSHGFKKCRIEMVETGRLEKDGDPIMKPVVVGVSDHEDQKQSMVSRQSIEVEMKG